MKRIKWFVDHFEEVISALLLFVIFILLGLTILFRLFGIPTTEMQEITQYSFVLSIFFGISYAAKTNEHIRADIVLSNVSEKVKGWLLLFGNVIWFAFTLALAWYSLPFIENMMKFVQKTPFLEIPFWVLYSFVPLTAVLTAIRIFQTNIWGLWKEMRKG
ncbi:TRAP transporter small permease [Paenibacillus chungangensis]|uniref:TRAP transporter small permease n=1 Tax=Paenibacillus chungangensis TaxID=696535 RepID=A0ABW3HNY6_9BACL